VTALAHPEWLAPAAGVLLFAGLGLALARRLAARRLARLMGAPARASQAARDGALLLALAAVLVALLGPRWGERERRTSASGIDVVILLDVSRSMEAADTPPSRLARALRAADGLLSGLGPADRAALAAFASQGVLLTPLTPDHDALRELLGGIDTELMISRGSALGSGVRAALAAFEAGSERPRALLLLSDGEDAEQGRDLPLAEARRAQVRVLAAGFGSEQGAMLPDYGAPLVDREGSTVVTRRRLEPLARLAAATGGEVFRADAFGGLETGALLRALPRGTAGPDGSVVRRERTLQVLPLAALAFALLLFEWLPVPRRLRTGRGAAAVAALGLLAAGPLAHPAALELQRAGIARLERGDAQGAARLLEAAALATRDTALAALAYYHLGVAHLAAGELENAKSAFFDALALDPEDAQARFDLEWTLAALARRPPPPPASQPAPESPEREAPRPAPEAGRPPDPGAGERREDTGIPEALGADERERLLRRIPDDPRHALRAVARSLPARAHARGPVW
jgi:Ca-activated chloride channel family protein